MATKEELILENELLKKKLALAEAWMRREIASHKQMIGETQVKKSQRKKLDNILERESVDIIRRRIIWYFGDSLEKAPPFTLEHLIDAEIYWQTLQKFPTLDALPVVSSYQKILDAFFERILVWFRKSSLVKGRLGGVIWKWIPSSVVLTHPNPPLSGRGWNPLDRDIQNVLEKKYTLSLGRWFQFFEKIRSGDTFGGTYEDLLLSYLTEHHERLLELCITDPVFSSFSELISLEVFGRKRHDTKISYSDARRVREIIVGNYDIKSLLKTLLIDTNNQVSLVY